MCLLSGQKWWLLDGKDSRNTVIFDGIKYNPGDELADLGSWVCTDSKGMVRDYEGLSKDVAKLPLPTVNDDGVLIF